MRAGHCASEVIHQFLDPTAAGQALAEKRLLKHPGNLARDAL
jgi:hypothetical protein